MKERVEAHPNLTTWLVLAVGMLVVLAWSARDVALSPAQWLWLALATVGLAGLCAWIISWEADEPDEDAEVLAPGDGDAEVLAPGDGDPEAQAHGDDDADARAPAVDATAPTAPTALPDGASRTEAPPGRP